MSRHRQSEKALLDLKRRIQKTYDKTPLQGVGKMLLEMLVGTTAAVEAGVAAPEQTQDAISFVGGLLESLPQSFADRFAFDAALISAIAEEWSAGGIPMSSMILPRYSNEWGHLTGVVPINRTHGHTIDVILIHGEDDYASIELLDYPWLCHELGHNLHFRNESFADGFQVPLSDRVRALRTRSVADRSMARARSLSQIEMLTSVWTPTATQKNWAHEIAADMVSLWVLGPAFLAAFQFLLEDTRPKPYHVNNEHPPYDLRASAIIDAAQRLQWNSNVDEIKGIQRNWRFSEHSAERTNEYLTLADGELVTAAVTKALATCDATGLPRTTPERVHELEESLAQGKTPELGSGLLIAAWIAESQMSESSFESWQAVVVKELAEAVTLEFQ